MAKSKGANFGTIKTPLSKGIKTTLGKKTKGKKIRDIDSIFPINTAYPGFSPDDKRGGKKKGSTVIKTGLGNI
jgi:hypothetical protein